MTTWFYPGQEDYITKLNELGAIADLVAGPKGWSPAFAVVSDGSRRVLQIVDWVGGEGTKPATGGYIGSTGIVGTAAQAIDIRGPQGATGNTGPANSLSIGTVTSGASASATISGTAPTQQLSLVLPKGDKGFNGWNPTLSVVTDGERRVLRIVDWVGGEGTKPATGGYIGATGIVATAALAVDIRGSTGAEGPANSLSIGTVSSGATASATITGTAPSQTLNLVLPKGDAGNNGTAATIAVGTVTTGAPGSSATIVNSGTSSAAVFNFTIPRGDPGAGTGDVLGPAGSVNNSVALFNGTTGKLVKDGGVLGTAAFSSASSFATATQGTKADTAVQPGSLAAVATSGAYADLTGKPTLGTASTLNVPATGNAATGEVVKGDDTRLSDSRTPTGTAGGVLSGSYPNPGFAVDMATQAELDAVSSVANSKLSDAPSDGKTYGRKNAAWAEAGDVTQTGTQTLTNKTIHGNANTLTVDGTNPVGFRHIPQNNQTANYTLTLDDAGKHIHKGGTTALTFTIPANATVAFPIGTAITFVNSGTSANISIAITTDTMRLVGAGTTGTRTLAPYGVATAIKVAAQLWMISGTNLT